MAAAARSAVTRTFAILALALAACAPQPPGGYRNAAVPIRSIALFEQSRLDGDWTEVAGYPLRPGCPGGSIAIAGGGSQAEARGCHLPLQGGVRLTPSGPGRFTAGGVEVWVLWVDADYRTAVLGTPGGGFGAVLNRGGPIPEDRMAAARRVLEFNGYDLSRLQTG